MLMLTSDAFADWFAGLDDELAEQVATAFDVVEQLGTGQVAPGSSESLLWYEHPSVSRLGPMDSLAWDLEAWGCFREQAKQILAQLDSARVTARLSELEPAEAAGVLASIAEIRTATDPRLRWSLKLAGLAAGDARQRGDACLRLRRLHVSIMQALGFSPADVPAHSLSLRELSRRGPGRGFRVLYGVHIRRDTALCVLGERLDRSCYGDSVRRAEQMWRAFLGGELRVAAAALR